MKKRLIIVIISEIAIQFADLHISMAVKHTPPGAAAPDIAKMIRDNRRPVSLTLDKLRRGIPDSWEEQRKLFLGE